MGRPTKARATIKLGKRCNQTKLNSVETKKIEIQAERNNRITIGEPAAQPNAQPSKSKMPTVRLDVDDIPNAVYTDASGNVISSGAAKGGNIVGTNFNKVLPTQDWINPAKVAEYRILLQSGQKLPAIDAYKQGGRIFIEDGHHRFAAYMELGLKPNMIIRNTGGPMGFPNWLNTTFQAP